MLRPARPGVLVLLSLLALLGTGSALAASWPELSAPTPLGGGEKDAALIVAIENYANVSPVRGARQNADDWFQYLVKGRKVPVTKVSLLLDEQAAREDIERMAREVAELAKPGGTVWFVFVGHGAPKADGSDGLLLGADVRQTAQSLAARGVPRKELLAALAKGKHARTVAVLDSCFSGRGTEGASLAPDLQPLLPVALELHVAGTVLLTAAMGDQFAGSLPGLSRPAFSYLTLGALRGWADEDGDGVVTAGEALEYTRGVLRILPDGRKQTPTLDGREEERLASGAKENGPDLVEIVRARAPTPGRLDPAPRPPTTGGPGRLDITATPTATVWIDGEERGRTPLRNMGLAAGAHTVTLFAPAHRQVNRQVVIKTGEPTAVVETLVPTAGFLDISVVPAGATLHVAGRAAAPGRSGPYPVGAVTVQAEAVGHEPFEQADVTISDGEATPLAITLKALPGKLVFSSSLDGECELGAGYKVQVKSGAPVVMPAEVGTFRATCRTASGRTGAGEATVEPGGSSPLVVNWAQVGAPPVATTATGLRSWAEPKAGYEWVELPGGTFTMGCLAKDTQCWDEEKPARKVTVVKFAIGKVPVTVEQYAKCAAAGMCSSEPKGQDLGSLGTWKNGKLNHPINALTWGEAGAFCGWVGGRLLTMEEWEYAAKSGEENVYPWGDGPVTGQRANYCDGKCPDALGADLEKKWTTNGWIDRTQNDGWAGTSPVGSYPAGATRWGLLDMAGNVHTWTSSKHGARLREVRGGSWFDPAHGLRASFRNIGAPADRETVTGVRCGLSR